MRKKGKRKIREEPGSLLLAVLIIAAVTVGCLIIMEALPYAESAHYQKALAEEVITEPDEQETGDGKTISTEADDRSGKLRADDNVRSEASTVMTEVYPEKMYRMVDWEALKKRNKDICGWICIPVIGADYPVLRSKEQEYLHLDADGSYRFSGSIFTWEKSDAEIGAAHCVLYGHNMADNSMFGALDQLQSGDKAYVYTPDGCCREYTVYENSVVGKSDKVFQKGWRDENRKQVLTLATCPSRRSDINRRIVNAELTLLKR